MSSAAASLDAVLGEARAALLAARTPARAGNPAALPWRGRLSSSALSTATATIALALSEEAPEDRARVAGGLRWLAAHQNDDGGWGDTSDSPSNLSTTLLARCALGLATRAGVGQHPGACARSEERLRAWLGALDPASVAAGLEAVYGEDRTFAVPILVACAAGETWGADADPWRSIPPLPFELAALPGTLFKWLGLPVVSYALPALIAIGQALHRRRPTRLLPLRLLRAALVERTLAKLARIQPASGGYLEAVPLTSFVVLSLVACGRGEHPVAVRGRGFLRASLRADGSWPIDSDLATWVTTLSVGALAGGGALEQGLDVDDRRALADWLLAQQFRRVHPYTGARPGGWAWTDLPGGVPDADDTPGALLALALLEPTTERREATRAAARDAVAWLCDLQNRDGGVPTFCKGWGKLPFDRSCPDLTAHALRAWQAWSGELDPRLARRVERARRRAHAHLVRTQRADGAWVPLWFGNQQGPDQQNPLYGTSRVLRAAGTSEDPTWRAAAGRGLAWLLAAQAAGGGFGGAPGVAPSVEETGLAVEALADAHDARLGDPRAVRAAVERALAWLAEATDGGRRFEPHPIGLYFAKLWYSEELYPCIFAVSALERGRALLGGTTGGDAS